MRIKIIALWHLLLFNGHLCSQNNNISYLFSHGIADTHEQAFWYTKTNPAGTLNERYTIPGRVFTFDFPDATEQFRLINFTKTSLAQGNEIIRLKQAFDETLKTVEQENEPNKGIVLMGLSRGAAAALSFMGIYNPKEVKALVLESPFDSTFGIVQNILRNTCLDWIPGLHTIGHSLVECVFMQHNKDGITPLQAVDMIQEDIPILLISSEQDSLVPAPSTEMLYKALRKSGKKNTYLFRARTGSHAKILQGAEGEKYQAVVHAFYKKHNLPHSPFLAQRGAKLLAECQPNL